MILYLVTSWATGLQFDSARQVFGGKTEALKFYNSEIRRLKKTSYGKVRVWECTTPERMSKKRWIHLIKDEQPLDALKKFELIKEYRIEQDSDLPGQISSAMEVGNSKRTKRTPSKMLRGSKKKKRRTKRRKKINRNT